MSIRCIVTGGAGFIGSNLVHALLRDTDWEVTVLDKLTYAGSQANLVGAEASGRYTFSHGDICDAECVRGLLDMVRPTYLFHLAAESHVDRSIDGPRAFVETNIQGTFELLEAARAYLAKPGSADRSAFRFVHVSTDEVFGSLGATGAFSETTPYAPNSPYAASKAASDHLARAYVHTYDLPVVITNCSNNYGPRQFPEKLMPLMILNALERKRLPVYGNGSNVRDWLYVEDHCAALRLAATRGLVGESYNIGGGAELTNLEVVHALCDAVDAFKGDSVGERRKLVSFVTDRPGHDARYAMDARKIERELGWKPSITFEQGLKRTVRWYLENGDWCRAIQDERYQRQRLGLHTQEQA